MNPTIEYKNRHGDILGFRQMGRNLCVTATTFEREKPLQYYDNGVRWISVYVKEQELINAVHEVHGDDVKIVRGHNTLYFIHIRKATERSVYINVGGTVWEMPVSQFDEAIRQSHLTLKELFAEKHKNDTDQVRKG